MTTFTLTGFSLTNAMAGDFTASFFEVPATLEIVVEDGQGVFSYVTTSVGETPPVVEIDITGLMSARLNGSNAIETGLESSIGTVTWDDGGIIRTTIFLTLEDTTTGLESIFAIGGTPFPVFADLAAFNLFASTQIMGVDGVTSGPFAPGEDIPLTGFVDVEITEDDLILGTLMDDTLNGGAGNDVINSFGGNDTINGGAGNDSIDGGLDDDIINGGDDNDFLNGLSGFNQVFGDAGDDLLVILSSNLADAGSIYDGGTGTDTLRVVSAAGATVDLRDYTLNNLETLDLNVVTGEGNFQINAAQFGSNFNRVESDELLGDSSRLSIFMDTSNSLDISGVTFTGFDGSDDVIAIIGDGSSENITGSHISDLILGDSGSDTLNGGEGDDFLLGGRGADTINGGDDDDLIDGGLGSGDVMNGGAGNDTILGGFGNDIIDGGSGIDTVSYAGFGGNITVNLNVNGNPQTSGGGGVDVITNVENIIGGDFADRLTGRGGDSDINGGAGGDIIFGLGGEDELYGEGANDFIQGGNGDDFIDGGAGQDQLNGGNDNDTILGGDDNSLDRLTGAAGDDILDGGGGRDILRGDSFVGGVNVTGGADIFDFNEVNDSLAGGLRDIIRDFVQGEDLMDLSDIDAITGGIDDAFTLIGDSGFSNTAGEIRYQFGGSSTVISADVDGDGIADMQIQLNGNIDLIAADFVL